MARAPDRWLGRCVRISGYVAGRYFFADVGGAYARFAEDRDDRRNDGWLGLYFIDRHVVSRPMQRGTVVGVVHDCGRDYAAEEARAGPNTLVMSTGYCHYQSGLVLLPATFSSSGSARFERKVSEAARRRFGNLEPERPGNRPPPAVVRLADRFLSGVRRGDGAGLATFVLPWSDEVPPETPAAQAAFRKRLAGEPGSPLRPIRLAGSNPQRVYFRERQSPSWNLPPTWHICFCRTGDCTGRWPIHSIDATAGPSRPYICVRAFNSTISGSPPDRIGIDRRESMFVEPPANNSTR
jgi:hypothetical protein